MTLVHEDMDDVHLLEVNDIVPLLHIILYGGYPGGKVLLPIEKPLQHATGNVMPLLLDDIEVFLYRIKFRL